MLNRKLLSNLVFLSFLAACTPPRQSLVQVDSPIDTCFEARLVDVPLPVAARTGRVQCATHDAAQLIPFTVAQSVEVVVEFYHHEMERLGWREEAAWQFSDTFCVFYTKPHRILTLRVRSISDAASECELLFGEKK